MSLPAWRSRIAQLWRRTCGVMVFPVSPGQFFDAVPTCLARRCWTASEDSRRHEAGIDASIVTVGDAHDNSLAESINGLYKAELIKPR